MTRGRAVRLALVGVAVALVTAVVLVAATSVILLRRPLPERDGEVTLEGLGAEVSVLRGEAGIADVYADTPADLFRAQGYLDAQERFYEMDVRRRVARGTLAELVGDTGDAVRSDVFARTMGFARTAEAELTLLDGDTRSALEAYARGVNDYLRDRSPSRVSIDYTLLGAGRDLPPIAAWTPVDTLAWLKYLAFDLSTNLREEIGRSVAYAAIGDADRVDQIYPPYPYAEHSPIVTGTGGSASRLPAAAVPRTVDDDPAASDGTGADGSDGTGADASGDGSDDAAEGSFAALRPALEATAARLAALPQLGDDGDALGSNAWAISGRYTASGKPYLANDPHLRVASPGLLFQIGLHCRTVSATCPYDVSGFGTSGLPGVLAGHNGTVSWGFAGLYADTTDLYLEQIGADAKSTLRDGEQQPMTAREEVVQVNGGDPITVTVRTTEHGPLVSDAGSDVARVGEGARVEEGAPVAGSGYGVSLAWTGSTPGISLQGILGLARASDFASFRAAAQEITAPALSFVYADTDGHIGYVAAGAVPKRQRTMPGDEVPADGTWPQPGWDSGRDWDGIESGADLPSVLDPKEGFVVAANQAVTRPISGVPLSRDFDAGYRSQRIRDVLAGIVDAGKKTDLDGMEALQQDTVNLIAPVLLPVLLKASVDSFTKDAQKLLIGWDYTQPGDSAAAAYFNAVWAKLLELTFSDELPQGIRPDGGARWFEVVRRLLDRPGDRWWDDRRTAGLVESRDGIIADALTEARLDLTSKLGKDPTRWRWERLHQVELDQSPVTSADNALTRALIDQGPIEVGGSSSVVNAYAWDAASGTFRVTTAPAFRMIVDLGGLDRSLWVAQTGVSGHPWDSHFDDQLDDWATGRMLAWPFGREAVAAAHDDELRLVPN